MCAGQRTYAQPQNSTPLPLDNIEKVDFSKEYKEDLPGFYRFTVDIDETADTFLDFEGWERAVSL